MAKIKTDYGYKSEGKTQFVIIAPHAAGDDLRSSVVARKLATKLNGFLIVNGKFKKPYNSKLKSRKYIQDFNRLYWSDKKQKYLWQNRKPEMKLFFNDIENYCLKAKKYSKEKKAVAVYLHSLKNYKTIGIDIGAGVKSLKDEDRFLFSFHDDNGNSGTATILIDQINQLKELLNDKLIKECKLSASIGKIHTGWSKSSAIQFHKNEGRNDYAIQFEINSVLRSNSENINYTANLLADILKKTF